MKTRPRARVCEHCGKSKGVTFHQMQTSDGRMRSVAAHMPCFKKIRAKEKAYAPTLDTLDALIMPAFTKRK